MSASDVIGLAFAVLAFAYLFYALVRGEERF